MDLFSPRHLLILIIMVVGLYWVVYFPYAVVFSRAGYTKWLSVLMLVPLVNIILMWWFAFANWTVRPGDKLKVEFAALDPNIKV